MRVLDRDDESAHLLIETESDLWHLYHLLDAGDRVRSLTERREEGQDDKVRTERGEKVRIWITLRVERAEFHPFASRLRILGTIEEGRLGRGRAHTLNVEPGTRLHLAKPVWDRTHRRRLLLAQEGARASAIVVAVEDDRSVVAGVYPVGVREIATVEGPGSMKGGGDKRELGAYYDDVARTVSDSRRAGEPVVVVGPGFWKEEVARRLRSGGGGRGRSGSSARGEGAVAVVGTAQGGMAGVREALSDGAAQILAQTRVAYETRLVDELMRRIGKGSGATYGPAEVESALSSGRAETLLVSDLWLRSDRAEGDRLFCMAETSACHPVLISALHPAGRLLENLGGVATLDRY